MVEVEVVEMGLFVVERREGFDDAPVGGSEGGAGVDAPRVVRRGGIAEIR